MDTEERHDQMWSMRHNDRMTLNEIGDQFGISRQRVHQIIGSSGHLNNSIRAVISNEDSICRRLTIDGESRESVAIDYGLSVATVMKNIRLKAYILKHRIRRCGYHNDKKGVYLGWDKFFEPKEGKSPTGYCRECNTIRARRYRE